MANTQNLYTKEDFEFINFVNNTFSNKLLLYVDNEENRKDKGKVCNIYFDFEYSSNGSKLFNVYYQIFTRDTNQFLHEDEASFVYLPVDTKDLETPEFCRGRCLGKVEVLFDHIITVLRG